MIDELRKSPSKKRRWLVGLVSAIAAVLLLGIYSPWSADVGPGTVQLSAEWSLSGKSTVQLPPLGSVSANTHDAPLNIYAALESVETDQLQRTVASDKPADQLEAGVRDDLGKVLPQFILRTLLIAGLIGLIAAALVSPSDRRALGVGLISAITAVGLLLSVTWRTYDVTAFEQPRFSGSLVEAPRVLSAVRKHVDGIDDVKARLGALSEQVSDLYRTTSPAAALGGYETSILHVSDIHSNPVGIELTKRLGESFGVDAIVDTGDLTSFGFPVEAKVVDLLDDMPAPYILIPGNHDSPEIRQQLATTPGVQLLDGTTATVAGIEILGISDPTFTATNAIDTQEATRIERESAGAVRDAVIAHPNADILAVHTAVQAEQSHGEISLILAGHAHERGVMTRSGTTTLVVGSTGAGGVEAFSTTEGNSYEAEVLHFDGDKLRAIDYVMLSGSDGNFSVSRSVDPFTPIPEDNEPQTEPDFDPSRRTTTSSSTTTTIEG